MEQREAVPILLGAMTAGPCSLKGGRQHQVFSAVRSCRVLSSPLQHHLPAKNTQVPTEQQNVESSPATIQRLWNCFMIAIEGFLFNWLIKSELALLCSLEKLLKHFS